MRITGGTVATPGGLRRVDVHVRDGKIAALTAAGGPGPTHAEGTESGAPDRVPTTTDPGTGDPWATVTAAPEPNGEIESPDPGRTGTATDTDELDASGSIVAPGFVDLQINGAGGIDLQRTPERMWELGTLLATSGVTAFLPTIISGPAEIRARALAALAAGPPPGWHGATPLGLHFEGPMLNPARRGAHPAEHLMPPSSELIAGWSRSDGAVLVTLAPELPGAREVVAELRARGVVVAAGHTDATAEQVDEARAMGITMVTHLFNAMSPFHHRALGVAGAVLRGGSLVAGLIADGVHVHPGAVAIAWRALGPERTVLVTDAVANPADTVLADGTLAGSTVTLDAALRNLIAFTGCDVEDALRTVTATPASVLGVTDRGAVAVGARADLTLLNPELEVAATIVDGRLVHLHGSRSGHAD